MWTIPINVFGKGLQLVHTGPIVVTGSAQIGDYAYMVIPFGMTLIFTMLYILMQGFSHV